MPSSLPWLVQKFGGTSIGKLLDTITEDIIPSYYLGVQSQAQRNNKNKNQNKNNTNNIAVICSARSGKDKSTGTTSLLLQAASLAEGTGPQSESVLDDVIDRLIEEHRLAAREALRKTADGNVAESLDDIELLTQLEREIVADCEAIRGFLHAAKVREI